MTAWDAGADPLPGQPYNDDLFGAFVYALVQEESTGSYDPDNEGAAGNSDGAIGAYQVLGSNVPEWSKEALGYSLTPEQYYSNHSRQDQVAQYQLLQDWYKNVQALGITDYASITQDQYAELVTKTATDWNPNYPSYAPSYANDIYNRASAQLAKAGSGGILGFGNETNKDAWRLPPDVTAYDDSTGYGGAAKPVKSGHWVSATGKPISDPPKGAAKANSANVWTAIPPNTSADKPLGDWSQATWVAVVHWISSYADDSADAGWYASWIKTNPHVYPSSQNQANNLVEIFEQCLTQLPEDGKYTELPDPGNVEAGIGPTGLSGLWDLLTKLLKDLTSVAFWERAGLFVLGGVILGFTVWHLVKSGG